MAEVVEVQSVVPVPQCSTWWVFHPRLSTFSRRHKVVVGVTGSAGKRPPSQKNPSHAHSHPAAGHSSFTHEAVTSKLGKIKYLCVNPRQRGSDSLLFSPSCPLCSTDPLLWLKLPVYFSFRGQEVKSSLIKQSKPPRGVSQ